MVLKRNCNPQHFHLVLWLQQELELAMQLIMQPR